MDTTYAQLLQRLKDAFNSLANKTVQGCINSTNKELTKLWQHIQDQEKVDEEEYAASDNEGDNNNNNDKSGGDKNDNFGLL